MMYIQNIDVFGGTPATFIHNRFLWYVCSYTLCDSTPKPSFLHGWIICHAVKILKQQILKKETQKYTIFVHKFLFLSYCIHWYCGPSVVNCRPLIYASTILLFCFLRVWNMRQNSSSNIWGVNVGGRDWIFLCKYVNFFDEKMFNIFWEVGACRYGESGHLDWNSEESHFYLKRLAYNTYSIHCHLQDPGNNVS